MHNFRNILSLILVITGFVSFSWAGIHAHIPRGSGGAAYHDSVEVDAGDQFIAAKADIDTAIVDSATVRAMAHTTIDSLTALGQVTALTYYGDGSNLTGVGASAATAVTISAKAAVDLTKGQVVYISGATGGTPEVSLADARSLTASAPIGIAAESKTAGQTIAIRVAGELTALNTAAFADGAILFLTAAGGYDDEWPTAGEIWRVAYVANSHSSSGVLLVSIGTNNRYLSAAAGDTLQVRMGDAAGTTSLTYHDSTSAVIGYINSDGLANFYGGLDSTTIGATYPQNVGADSVFVGGNIQIKGTDGHGADGAIVWEIGTAPTETITNGIALWVEDVSESAELRVRDEADNVNTLSSNVEEYPERMATDPLYPYVKMYENSRVGIRTYIAERRAMKLLQEMAQRMGLLGPDSLIIADELIPVMDWEKNEQRKINQSIIRRAQWIQARGAMIAQLDSLRDAGAAIPAGWALPDLEDAPAVYQYHEPPAWVKRSLDYQGR